MYNLLKRARKGDEEALKDLIDKFIPLILKEASRYRIKGYDYEDLVQHGYLSVIKVVNVYKGEDRYFQAYCIKAIKTNFKALLKKEIRHYREVQTDDINNLQGDDYSFLIEDELIAYEKIKEVYEALDSLEDYEREVIDEVFFKNKTMGEVAATGNKTYNQVRYTKNQVIKKLQKKLAQFP